jgi:23S rRNA (cytidine1920-2'-O)/16S rRNA (cytidine1409-2'-O)-methyltransferase
MTRADSVRADVALVSRGVVRSRALAQRLIDAGAVDIVVGGKAAAVSRASQPVFPEQELRVKESPESRFASRGGAKLAHALAECGIDCSGIRALDVGMSTGGFTDCLLQHGAATVAGIEVGHGQLDARLAADGRVTCFEKTHVRDVSPAWLAEHGIEAGFDLIVVDLSFISTIGLLGHLAALAGLAGVDTRLVALIKPQFELGPDARNSKGIVRADADIEGLREQAWAAARESGWQPTAWFACSLPGTDGNQEYFLAARREPLQSSRSSTAPGRDGRPTSSGQP